MRIYNHPGARSAGLLGLVLLAALCGADAQAAAFLGPRAGISSGDDFFVGVQGEFGRVLDEAVFTPSLDLKTGDGGATTANLDLRWDLIRVPDTGLRFYGSGGPTFVLSPGSELGLSLNLGLRIPMSGGRHYNLEYRFGLGDIPDRKFAVAVLFGL